MKKFVIVKDLLMEKFLSDKRLKEIQYKNEKIVLYYEGFFIEKFKNVDIINVIENSIFIFDNMFEVTGNKIYENIEQKNYIKRSNIVLEGPDGVGKTTLAKSFVDEGILVKDREINNITKMMHDDVSEETRLLTVSNFLTNNPEKDIVFMILNKENLLNRISNRKNITEYDKKSLIYLEFYKQIYYQLNKYYSNLHLLNCDNSSVEELKQKTLKLVKYEN